jgi:hypothetical protein
VSALIEFRAKLFFVTDKFFIPFHLICEEMMTNQLGLNDYKQRIADLYNRRSQTYDASKWHIQICQRLLEYALIRDRQHVLDIATPDRSYSDRSISNSWI